jgi:glycerol uptake facilitator-like aquaporin
MPNLSIFGGFLDQVVATTLLIIIVLAVGDKRNVEMPHGTAAIIMGLTVVLIGTSFAYNCGYAINPARDFGPRLFTAMAGWGSQVFTAGHYFFWIPIVGPLVGSVLGTFIYLILISNQL